MCQWHWQRAREAPYTRLHVAHGETTDVAFGATCFFLLPKREQATFNTHGPGSAATFEYAQNVAHVCTFHILKQSTWHWDTP